MEDDSKIYTDCILALRSNVVETEEHCKSYHSHRKVAANVRPETPEEDPGSEGFQITSQGSLGKLWSSTEENVQGSPFAGEQL